ncbi:divergent polysaccharide deacetylase family protein [uncultured Campylobacter sp.]|uniref:divergent polysaccharide deacetylase family protein n=1 Tax=uncultured Campylobacter sp. TaxID=218934 RepID=UPI00260D5113|nr:divergent polysaccharide deacetylase family protein [uncultured Campylobacter sp.]
MANTNPRGRRKKRPINYATIAFVVILCFLSGAVTYAVLDLVFAGNKAALQQSSRKQASESPSDSRGKKPRLSAAQKEALIQKELDKIAEQNVTAPKLPVEPASQNSARQNLARQNSANGDSQNSANSMASSNSAAVNSASDGSDVNFTAANSALENSINSTAQSPASSGADDLSKSPRKALPAGSRAKLAIIIDDVGTDEQAQKIAALPVRVTPSIFPPEYQRKDTRSLARGFEHYAIHLPMEASSAKNNSATLRASDNYEKLNGVIAKLRTDFPNAKFINNHTGSKFTADERAMQNLLRAMNEHGFLFIDSRTSPATKAKAAMNGLGMRYVHRDVFLDNQNSVAAVRKKLREAVALAKKQGYAIAIGHPKSSTLRALANSADILGEVDLVYLDEIYEYYE